MTDEYSTPTKKKKKNIINSSDFTLICSLILSHPLYFSYLIFFSPYLFKLVSFLCPLFITSSLVFLSLLTTFVPLHSIIKSEEGFFIAVYNTLLEKLRNDEGEKWLPVEEFEVYKIVFETPIVELMEEYPDERDVFEDNPVEKKALQEEGKAGSQCESVTMKHETGDAKSSVVREEVKKYDSILGKSKSEVNEMSSNNDLKSKGGSLRLDREKRLSEAFYQTAGSPPYMGSFGSIRKEREWRRTLACMLFEERHNGGYNNTNGGNNDEGMDLLWETYETESNKGRIEEQIRKGRREKNQGFMVVNEEKDDDYHGEEEEDDDNGKFCCLQALKLSAGKMNLSVGRPSLIKFGKAFKGIGWLQSRAKRQGKKGYK